MHLHKSWPHRCLIQGDIALHFFISKLTVSIEFQLPRTEEDIVAVLPDKSTTLEIMSITKLFSTRPEKSLGEWEFQSQYDPFALKAEKEWVDHTECSSLWLMYTRSSCVAFVLDPEEYTNAFDAHLGCCLGAFVETLSSICSVDHTLWRTAGFFNRLETFSVKLSYFAFVLVAWLFGLLGSVVLFL